MLRLTPGNTVLLQGLDAELGVENRIKAAAYALEQRIVDRPRGHPAS